MYVDFSEVFAKMCALCVHTQLVSKFMHVITVECMSLDAFPGESARVQCNLRLPEKFKNELNLWCTAYTHTHKNNKVRQTIVCRFSAHFETSSMRELDANTSNERKRA